MNYPKLLTATKLTGYLVFDPSHFCGDKPLARLYRTAGMIFFQSRDIDHRIVQTLGKFCVNPARICLEHAVPPEGLKPGWGDIRWEDYQRRTQVSLRWSKLSDCSDSASCLLAYKLND